MLLIHLVIQGEVVEGMSMPTMKHMTPSTLILKMFLMIFLGKKRSQMLIVEEMREHYVRLQGKLESSTMSIACQQSLQIVLHNLNRLIESYVGVGPSTHIFSGMMHRRRTMVMRHHKFEEIKNIFTK